MSCRWLTASLLLLLGSAVTLAEPPSLWSIEDLLRKESCPVFRGSSFSVGDMSSEVFRSFSRLDPEPPDLLEDEWSPSEAAPSYVCEDCCPGSRIVPVVFRIRFPVKAKDALEIVGPAFMGAAKPAKPLIPVDPRDLVEDDWSPHVEQVDTEPRTGALIFEIGFQADAGLDGPVRTAKLAGCMHVQQPKAVTMTPTCLVHNAFERLAMAVPTESLSFANWLRAATGFPPKPSTAPNTMDGIGSGIGLIF